MEYRKLGKTNIDVSEVGLGCEYFTKASDQEACRMINSAFSVGINIIDVFMPEPYIRDRIAHALNGRRHQVLLQGHVGAVYEDGQYKRTRKLEKAKAGIQDFLQRFHTDYIDIGMLHYVDTMEDFEEVKKQGILKYMQEQKQKGVFRMLGVSSHNPAVAIEMIKTGVFEVLMFSINPIFDFVLPNINDFFAMKEQDSFSDIPKIDKQRAELYALCEELGVGITVMKSLAGGSLLNALDSPFHEAMSVSQCIQYALDRPAVSSVLVGCANLEEVVILGSYDKKDNQKSYVDIISKIKDNPNGKCMYCNHCLPCPKRINIAEVIRCYDGMMHHQEPERIKEIYDKLDVPASACIKCGACMKRCPFKVNVIEKMEKAEAIFKK